MTGDLHCIHCGMTTTYADANIEDIRGDGCPENTRTLTSGSREATIKQSHEWEEV